VGVDVRYGLARLRAGVEHHPVALVADPLGHRHLVSLGDDLVQQSGAGISAAVDNMIIGADTRE
jgi:hypothetical protein